MICINCVAPAPLKVLIKKCGSREQCQYCSRESDLTVSTDLLFKYIYDRVEENLASEDDLSRFEYYSWQLGSDDIGADHIDIVLAEWFNLQDEPYFEDLCANPPSSGFDADAIYYRDDGALERNFYDGRWAKFVADTRHTHRFFNPSAREFLDDVFSILTSQDGTLKPVCIRVMRPGDQLYRARKIFDYASAQGFQAKVAENISPPPNHLASSQRMTPQGIAALYTALERDTCLSEIRSITGDRVVSVALTPITEVNLLDLTKLAQIEAPSLTLLDEGYLDACHLRTFIASLVEKMSKPQVQNDELSNLSTQIVFEYLRIQFGALVDGLVFPSVQTASRGTNVVFFPELSGVSDGIPTLFDDLPGIALLANQAERPSSQW
ncbi:MAG: RES domain-containing protein [Achromobacter xylosoxidans]